MAIHDVAVNPIGACGFDAMNFLGEPREICRKNGWGDDNSSHERCSNGLMESWQAHGQNSSTPILRHSNRIRLTTCYVFSCYRVSAARIAPRNAFPSS